MATDWASALALGDVHAMTREMPAAPPSAKAHLALDQLDLGHLSAPQGVGALHDCFRAIMELRRFCSLALSDFAGRSRKLCFPP